MNIKTNLISKSWYPAVLCLLGFIASSPSLPAKAPFNYTYDFSERGETHLYNLTSSPTKAGGYFYKLTNKGNWQYWGGGDAGTLLASWKGGESFIIRKLTDGAVLPMGNCIQNPSFSLDSSWQWGTSSNHLLVYMGLFDAEGRGYLAATSVTGAMAVYQVESINDLKDASSWRLLSRNATAFDKNKLPIVAGGKSNTIKGNLHHIITFAIQGTTLTLKTSIDAGGGITYPLKDVDPEYANFTTLVIGGTQANNEKLHLDDIIITGSLVP